MNKEEMLEQIMQFKFSMIDLGLYLDTHTFDTSIIDLYNEYNKEYCELVKQYEEQFGPLITGTTKKDFWNWTQNPWPWEFE